jgi:SAM-dependent methyltransferase
VVGLDLSEHLLEEAREILGEQPGAASLVRGDMLRLPFRDGALASVASFFTSFGYFAEDRENLAVLQETARVLRPGGKLWLDYLNEENIHASLEPETERTVEGLHVREERRLTGDGRRLEKIIHITGREGEKVYRESVRLYSRDELTDLLAIAGIKVTECFGGYDGTSCGPGTPRVILVGEKL